MGLYGGTSVNFGTLISSRTIFSLGGEEVASRVLFLLAGVPRLVLFYLAAPANLNLDMGFPLLSRRFSRKVLNLLGGGQVAPHFTWVRCSAGCSPSLPPSVSAPITQGSPWALEPEGSDTSPAQAEAWDHFCCWGVPSAAASPRESASPGEAGAASSRSFSYSAGRQPARRGSAACERCSWLARSQGAPGPGTAALGKVHRVPAELPSALVPFPAPRELRGASAPAPSSLAGAMAPRRLPAPHAAAPASRDAVLGLAVSALFPPQDGPVLLPPHCPLILRKVGCQPLPTSCLRAGVPGVPRDARAPIPLPTLRPGLPGPAGRDAASSLSPAPAFGRRDFPQGVTTLPSHPMPLFGAGHPSQPPTLL